MIRQRSPDPERKDEFLKLLADRYRRATISFFRESSSECASVSEIASELHEQGFDDRDRIARRLHHSVLPRMDDAGVTEYDPRTLAVRYRGDAGLEALIDAAAEI